MSLEGKSVENSLTELVAGVRASSLLTGGSQLSSYNTIAYSNNYSLITLNRSILTYLYSGNGIFQTAIDLPIQDAIGKGIEINSSQMSGDDINQLLDWMETNFNDDFEAPSPWEVLSQTFTWGRLYGGGASIINNGEDPSTPFNIQSIYNKPFELHDVDRWQIDTGIGMYRNESIDEDWTNREYYYLHGVKIHKSRVLRVRGKRAPYYVRRQLRGWGMSEGERMIRDLNNYLKTQDVLYEILDESKIDVFKIKGFNNLLGFNSGTSKVTDRVTMANQLKNYLNALVMDLEDEYEQKSIAFGGLAEVMRENRIGVASAFRMPMTKLFGLSASGFNTGESDLENYNQMVEGEIRRKIKPLIRAYLDLGCMHLFGFIPQYTFEFPSLRVLSAIDEESVKTSKQNRMIALYDRGIIDSEELAQSGKKDSWLEIETKAESGLLPSQPTPPSGGEFIGDSISGPGESGTPFKAKEEVFE